jgi:phytol kinase
MLIRNDLLASILISFVLFVIFFLGKVIYSRFNTEISRKSVHIFSSLFSLTFPFLITNHFTLLTLSIIFSILIVIFRFLDSKVDFLKSVVDIDRKTIGEIIFPFAIYLIFIFSKEYYVYLISILVLGLSDSLAAIVGKKYGTIKIKIEEDYKSLEGSIFFLLVTFLAVEIPLLLLSNLNKENCILIALSIAILITMLELISIYGVDNILVPLGVNFLIQKLSTLQSEYIIYLLFILIVIIFTTFAIFWFTRLISFGGIIGITIVNYATFTLAGINYFLILIYFEFLFIFLKFIINYKIDYKYDVNSIFYTNLVNILIVFIIHFEYNLRDYLFPIFIAINSWHTIFIADYFYLLNKLKLLKRITNLIIILIVFIIPLFFILNLSSYLTIFLLITVFILTLTILLDLKDNLKDIRLQKYRFIVRNLIILISIFFWFVIDKILLQIN